MTAASGVVPERRTRDCLTERARDISVDWLARRFDLGRIRTVGHAGSGQKNRLGVLRLDTAAGAFAVKQLDACPTSAALAIEDAAWYAGFAMPRPRRTTDGARYATYGTAAGPVWV